MITVPEATKKIVQRSRYLSEALSKNLINYSSLARYIKPELESMLMKKVSDGAIIMALKRTSNELKPSHSRNVIFTEPPQMTVSTNLSCARFSHESFASILYELAEIIGKANCFFCATEKEAVIIAPTPLLTQTISSVELIHHVACIRISLPPGSNETPGVHYFFLKSLAWEGINILESFSTSEEYILVFSDTSVLPAFRILMSLFTK